MLCPRPCPAPAFSASAFSAPAAVIPSPRFRPVSRTGLCLISACLAWLAMAGLWSPELPAQEQPLVDCDIRLQGGLIHDGSGGPPVLGDIAITKGQIVAIGKFPVGRSGQTIDCRGLIIAPGFIDLHTHSDDSIVERRTRANVNYLLQGCTTIVTGNCGSGPVDTAKFYRRIDEAGAGSNVCHLIPQGNLRSEVVGSQERPATPEEIAKMKQLAEKAMQDGAWGMSTGLIYVPSSYANTDELVEIASVVAAHHGFYASHIRGEGTGLLVAVQEALDIGRRAKLPVHVSHFKSTGQEAWGLIRRAATLIEAARQKGEKVTADQYPYTASSTSLEATLIPTWARAGTPADLLVRIDHAEQGPKIREAIQTSLEKAQNGQAIRISRYASQPEWAGKSLAEIATAEKTTPLEIAIRITRGGGAGVVNFGMSEDDVRFAMQLPWVATASDGRGYLPGADKPHPRSYGTFARKVGHYCYAEKHISMEHAIRSSSALPAEILGLKDRGLLKSGFAADVIVFDPNTFRDTATFDEPHQYAVGMKYVFVNGTAAVLNGIPTGALAGRALKHNAPVPLP